MSKYWRLHDSVELAKLSPTFSADLAEMKKRGVRIHWSAGACQAYTPAIGNKLVIGLRCSQDSIVRFLAHEAGHVLLKQLPFPIPARMSEEEFVAECLECETEALVHEATIVDELLGLNVYVDCYQSLNLMRRGGRRAIRAAVGTMVTSTTGETYDDYYRRLYRFERAITRRG